MKQGKFLATLCLGLLVLGCGPAAEEKAAVETRMMREAPAAAAAEVAAEAEAMSNSTTEKSVSSSAAVETGKDSSRKFVRTADLKFKVKSVIKSTYDIEAITSAQGGFVSFTNLTSEINNVATTAISSDSSLETTYFTVSNSITLRVPNTRLDTTLKAISRNIEYLDYRIIKADDVALQILSNKLAQKRYAKNERRLEQAIDNRGKKLTETTNAEELLLRKQEESDNALINNLSLADQISYSTITLNIYQRQGIKRELIANDKNIKAYEAGLGTKILEALKSGWYVIEAIVVFFVQIWGLLLIGLIGLLVYKKYRHKL